jgi:hypothetical protein
MHQSLLIRLSALVQGGSSALGMVRASNDSLETAS